MFYNGITETTNDFGQYRVRVDLGDNTTMFFWFNHEPTEAEVIAATELHILRATVPPAIDKSAKLMIAEDRYVLFCRSLGLPDKAGSTELEALATSLKEAGQPLQAIEISLRALALVNDITQNGGKWDDIVYHGIVTA